MTSKTPAADEAVPAPRLPAIADLERFAPKSGMTPGRLRFTQEFIADLDGTAAYQRAFPDCESVHAAAVEASRLLRVPVVREEIQRLLDERATVTGITADRVLMRAWEIATADVRELVEYIVGSCRHCWGMYHQHQYTDAEFSAAQDKHIREQAKAARDEPRHEAVPFPERGGDGFDPKRPPNPECPECWGDGRGRILVKDTRKLSPGAAALFSGIKVDKNGNESVVIEDRHAYLQLVARHLGMDKRLIGGDPTNPLYALIMEIQQQHSTLPIAVADPEAIDVVARTVTQPALNAGSPMKTGWKAAKP